MKIFSIDDKKEEVEKDYRNQWKAIFSFILELIKIVVISLVIIIPIRAYVAQPFYVEGASMEPNFYDKEYLIIDEISYRFANPERGDVIIFRPPNNYKVYYIKRIIGLPGETMEVKDNQIKIFNDQHPTGFVLDESKYLGQESFLSIDDRKIILKDEQYFVLGDNRRNSLDSRMIGPINRSNIKGQVLIRAFPFNRFTIFSGSNFNN